MIIAMGVVWSVEDIVGIAGEVRPPGVRSTMVVGEERLK
jgi:hypothetical protein